MEELVKLETQRIQKQNGLMSILDALPPSELLGRLDFFESVNQFCVNELSEGLNLRWNLLDQIEAEVEKIEELVGAQTKSSSWFL